MTATAPAGDPQARRNVAAVVMAAGKGTRLRSSTAKVLHGVAGRSMLEHVLGALAPLGLGQVIVVVGHQADAVAAHAEATDTPNLTTVVQEPQLGTGHTVEVAMSAIGEAIERVLVVNGDAPLLTPTVLGELADVPVGTAALLATTVDDPTGYGRVLRDDAGTVTAIVEHRDATDAQRAVREINAGMYAFDRAGLADRLAAIDSGNEQGERYVTSLVEQLVADGLPVRGVVVPADTVAGVNDRAQLSEAAAVLRARHTRALQVAGATIVDPAATWIDVTVTVAPDAVVLPGCTLTGTTSIAVGAEVGPHSTLHDTTVGQRAKVRHSWCDTATIGASASVGPFAHVRPHTDLGAGGKIGAFAETKNATIGADSKVPHLAYVGDATVGTGVNFACGSVTVNYDGRDKHHTTIGDDAFVGCDSMLVAPVQIGDGAYVAAGSVITEDVPADALAIARSRQVTKPGWAAQRRNQQQD